MDGYKIIDFKGVDLTDGAIIEGIYNAIDSANKPIVVINLNSGNSGILKPFYSLPLKWLNDTYYLAFELGTPDGVVFASIEIDSSDTVGLIVYE